MRTRPLIVTVHRWTGLTVGLIAAMMALTGIPLIFRAQLEPAAEAGLFMAATCSQTQNLDDMAAAAIASHPDAKLDYVRIPGGQARAYMFRFRDTRTVHVDPCSGAVLGEKDRFGGFFGRLEQIHRFRYLSFGDWVSGLTAAGMLIVLFGGGIFLWWPRRAAMLPMALKFQSRLKGWPRLISLHKVVGLYAGLIIALSAYTGLPQAFDRVKDAIYVVAGSPLPVPPPDPKPATPTRSLESEWRIVQQLEPSPRETLIHIPRKDDESVEIYFIPHDAPHANARSYLYLARDGAILSYTPLSESSLGHRIYFWGLSWHTGVAGWFGQIVLLTAAGAVLTLAYTGISTYLRRRSRG